MFGEDTVISNELAMKLATAHENILRVEWAEAALRQLKPSNTDEAIAIKLVGKMLEELGAKSKTDRQAARVEADDVRRRQRAEKMMERGIWATPK